MSTRPPVPPVNLKDRIALLEQRKAAEAAHAQHSAHLAPASTRVGALKEKIASFEKQGAVPIPRSSFGIGAPPVDDGSSRRKGELYGNRIPGLSKPTIDSVPVPRNRTKSTSHLKTSSISTSSRPVTPSFSSDSLDEEPLPPLPNLGGARLPSTVSSIDRRAVSDVLPQRHMSYDSDDAPLKETEEEHVATDSAPSVMDNAQSADDLAVPSQIDNEVAVAGAPAILVSPDAVVHDMPADLPTHIETNSEVPGVITSPSSPYEAGNVSEPPSRQEIAIDMLSGEKTSSPTSTSSQLQSPSSPSQELPSAVGETPSDFTSSPRDVPSDVSSSVDPSPLRTVAVDELPIGTQVDISPISSARSVSRTDVLSTATSPVTTLAESVFSAEGSVTAEAAPAAAEVPSPSLRSPLSVVVSMPATSSKELNRIVTASSSTDIGDDSLAMDASEAVIVSDPLLVSPTITQGKLVPAPRPTNPTPPITPATASTANSQESPSSARPPVQRINLPPLLSPTPSEDLFSIEKQNNRVSFHAVVHEKVRQNSPAGSTKASPVDGPPVPAVPRALKVVRSAAKIEPDSPNLSDLADLMLDAALLEEQLSDEPLKKPASVPIKSDGVEREATPVQPTEPEKQSEPQSQKRPQLEPIDVPPAPQVKDMLSEIPVTPMRMQSLPEHRIHHRPEPSQELPESVEEDGPSEVERDLAKEMDIHFTKSWIPASLEMPSPGSSSLPYLAGTPPQSPAASRPSYSTPTRNSTSSAPSLPTRMRTISHSPSSSPSRTAPTRLRTISHHNLSRASDEIPPTPPPKEPRKYFNSLMRKPTMPGSFPRNSVSSEDSSVTPPSPPLPPPPPPPHDYESIIGSDSSSIRSSTKSHKSGKDKSKHKEGGLSRATSVMDKLWRRGKNKHASVTVVSADEDGHLSVGGMPSRDPSPNHLSPYNVPPILDAGHSRQLSSSSSLQQRPTSWVSVSTTGSSGEPFDTDIFDAFPSVPGEVPPLPSDQSKELFTANSQRRPASSAPGQTYSSRFLASASEMGMGPPKAAPQPKQRSTLL